MTADHRIAAPKAGQTFADWVGATNVYGVLERAARSHGDAIALCFLASGEDDAAMRRFSYLDLLREVSRAANTFRRLGAGRDAVIAYLLPSLPETQFILWGAETSSVAFPLNPLLHHLELAALCDAAGVSILVALGPVPGTDIWVKALRVRDAMAERPLLLRVGGAVEEMDDAPVFAQECALSEERLAFDDRPGLDDLAAYFHTGGTTGAPKLVRHTHGNQIAAAYGGAFNAGITPADVIMNGLPMFHVASTIFCSLGIYAAGAQVLLLSPAGFRNPSVISGFWRIAERCQVTIVGGVPTALGAAVGVSADGIDLSRVRVNISGASALPRATANRLEQITGKPVREVYGMTESGGVICVDPNDRERVLGSAGLPIPFCEVRARPVDAPKSDLSFCAPGEPGVLLVRGPNVSQGYRDAQQSQALFTPDGWLITGDLGHVAADGRVFVTGRSKDLIIRSGHNIDPAQIEARMLAHPAVADAAAVGMPDAYAGEVPVVYVALRPGAAPTEAELLDFARDGISEPPAMPRRVFVIERIPQTAVGKPFKPALRQDCAERHLRDRLSGQPLASLRVEDHPLRGRVVHIALQANDAQSLDSARAAVAGALEGYLFTVELA